MSNHPPGVEIKTEVMTVHDLARYLRLSEAKVYKMAKAGFVPAIRIGKSWRFKRDVIDEWLQKEAQPSSRMAE